MKHSIRRSLCLAVFALCLPSCKKRDMTPPTVLKSFPAKGNMKVDPSLSKITVTFDRPMKRTSWSWAYTHKHEFPKMTGKPTFDAAGTTCSLPVKLKPKHKYVIWINSPKFTGFKSQYGVSALPYKLVFQTR